VAMAVDAKDIKARIQLIYTLSKALAEAKINEQPLCEHVSSHLGTLNKALREKLPKDLADSITKDVAYLLFSRVILT